MESTLAVPLSGIRENTGGPQADLAALPYTWSPDGQWLAGRETNSYRGGFSLLRLDGSEERRVGQRSFSDRPVWSPDSKSLIYTRLMAPWPDANALLPPAVHVGGGRLLGAHRRKRRAANRGLVLGLVPRRSVQVTQ